MIYLLLYSGETCFSSKSASKPLLFGFKKGLCLCITYRTDAGGFVLTGIAAHGADPIVGCFLFSKIIQSVLIESGMDLLHFIGIAETSLRSLIPCGFCSLNHFGVHAFKFMSFTCDRLLEIIRSAV